MQLYNSATHQKEEFIPHTPGKVSMYTCGPTVYHFAHIGNLRTYMMEDVLEKYLRYAGYDVTRVMNITDVGHLSSDADEGEDKMLKGARREKKTVMEIAKFYTDAFFADCEKLNIKTPDIVQPATGCIDEYIHLIETLLEKGYAYEAGGNIYFDTSKLEKYYIFNDFKEEDLDVGVREGVEADGNKKSKADFVLWFTKSKGEFLTVSLLEEKGYDPMVYRFFCLQSHYRKSLVFSWENMDNAAVAYNKLIARIAALDPAKGEVDDTAAATLKEGFVKALDNDLNTSLAVTAIYDVLKAKVSDATKLAVLADFDTVLSVGLLDRAATLRDKLAAERAAHDAAKQAAAEAERAAAAADPFVAEILAAIDARKAAKKEKNFAEADRIRDELAAKGVTLIDTPQGTTYKIN